MPAMQLSKRTIGIAAAIITVAIWTSFIIIARAMAHKTLTPFDIAFVRMVGAGIVMLPWGWWCCKTCWAPGWRPRWACIR